MTEWKGTLEKLSSYNVSKLILGAPFENLSATFIRRGRSLLHSKHAGGRQ